MSASRIANHDTDFARSADFSTEERDDFLARISRFVNATRFAAKLLQKGISAVALPLEATCCLQLGLEYPYNKNASEGPNADEFPLLIPAATTWLLIAGEMIYEHCSSGDTSNGWDRGSSNLQRWELWKKQLRALRRERGLQRRVSRACRTNRQKNVGDREGLSRLKGGIGEPELFTCSINHLIGVAIGRVPQSDPSASKASDFER